MSTSDLPWETAACWGAFLYDGMLDHEKSLEPDHYLVDHYIGGYLELVTEATALIPVIWEEAQSHPKWEGSHPGVFEYEVISTLGEYLAEQLVHDRCLPDQEEVRAIVRFSIRQFFNQA